MFLLRLAIFAFKNPLVMMMILNFDKVVGMLSNLWLRFKEHRLKSRALDHEYAL